MTKASLGVIFFNNTQDPFDLQETILVTVERYVHQLETAINNARLYENLKNTSLELEHLNQNMLQDLNLASEIQNFTMRFPPDSSRIKGAVVFSPCSTVSGDYYDGYLNREGHLRMFLGDATGHGMSAALITMMTKMGLNNLSSLKSPAQIMHELNLCLASCIPPHTFITGIYLCMTPEGELTFCNAGHPELIIIPADTGTPFIPAQKISMPLGVLEEEVEAYTEQVYQLRNGDKFLIYTDGVTECNSNEGLFGMDRLFSVLGEHSHLAIKELLSVVEAALDNFMPHGDWKDDVTIVGFQLELPDVAS
ncbi:MAG: serine/threonine-protein phosphatase [SAR324 cluster bacterium]|nr:serine/threonine-protein phosphatase [SAR324 cluster bacterium]